MLSSLSNNPLFSLNRKLAAKKQSAQRYGREYLGDSYFVATIVGAFVLHLLALYLYHLMPTTQVVDIPVRALNIKLGDTESLSPEELLAAQPDAANKSDVETAISKLVQSPDLERMFSPKNPADKTPLSADKDPVSKAFDKAMTAPGSTAVALVQESAQKLSNIARQFVRVNGMQASGKTSKEAAGNKSAKDAEMMSRYEQLISLWIEKFKLYPDDARAQGMQGETVVRIRIDRQGNIRYYILENSTGYQLLDRAAIDMVKRANPVPAVPNDYPKGDLIEFLIPVNFHLQ